MSRCSKGNWTKPLVFPAGELSDPNVVQSPDKGDLACGKEAQCKDLALRYNPNQEPGTEFYCLPKVESWDNLPVKISRDQKCLLLCDRRPVARLECKKGSWTGQPSAVFGATRKEKPSSLGMNLKKQLKRLNKAIKM